jgi:hypothetical protein
LQILKGALRITNFNITKKCLTEVKIFIKPPNLIFWVRAVMFRFSSQILIKMTIELDRKGLEMLIVGSQPYYNEFNNQLVKKTEHDYQDQYCRTSWRSLQNLTDDELYKLYIICRNSWS